MSTDSPTDQYLTSVERVKATATSVKRLIERVMVLREWPNILVTNDGVGGGFPPKGKKTLDLMEWPDAKKLANTLKDYYVAEWEMRSLWNNVPQERRNSIVNPDSVRRDVSQM